MAILGNSFFSWPPFLPWGVYFSKPISAELDPTPFRTVVLDSQNTKQQWIFEFCGEMRKAELAEVCTPACLRGYRDTFWGRKIIEVEKLCWGAESKERCGE